MRILYSIGIAFYTLGIRIAALFGHDKARRMVMGWRDSLTPFAHRQGPVAWFHASSLGEFEQARPVLEAWRSAHPTGAVVVTFFSPSGYEVRKNYPLADVVRYLPPDSKRNARRLVERMQPSVVFFVKYDFWYNCLAELRRHSIDTYLISAIFRPRQYFFRPWGIWFRRQLDDCFTTIFVQNEESLALLRSNGIVRCRLAGDTRYDRVHQIAAASEPDAVVEQWLNRCGNDFPVVVAGSTWPPDEDLLAACRRKVRLVLAPHVISDDHLEAIARRFPHSVRYSQLKEGSADMAASEVLVIDNIGLLSRLYRYADVAYIGGGFGVGIHNTLEAVAFGKPVLFGPNYRKFQEACDLVEMGGGFTHTTQDELDEHLGLLLDDAQALAAASDACRRLMQRNLGSTDIILGTIEKK